MSLEKALGIQQEDALEDLDLKQLNDKVYKATTAALRDLMAPEQASCRMHIAILGELEATLRYHYVNEMLGSQFGGYTTQRQTTIKEMLINLGTVQRRIEKILSSLQNEANNAQ